MAVLKYKDNEGNYVPLNNVKINLLNDIDDKVLISTENATLSSNYDSSINGKTRALLTYNTHVYITPKDMNGLIFNYFIDNRNQIVSYDKNFDTWLRTDKMYRAVYSDTEVEKQPLLYFNDNGIVDLSKSLIRFNFSSRIPASYRKVEWGFLLSPFASTPEELVYGGENAVQAIKDTNVNTATMNNVDFIYNFTSVPEMFESINHMNARVYAKINKDSVEEIIYSDIMTVVW